MKLFRRTRGLTLIGLWAFAPPVVVQSNGRGGFEVSSGGQYEVVSRNCSGDFVSSRPVPVRTGGVLLEFEPSTSPFRVAGFGGMTSVCQRRLKKLQTWRVKMLHPAEVTSL